MKNVDTDILKVSKAPCEIVMAEDGGCEEKYIIQYKWKKRDTNEAGTFIGHFHINFNDKVVADGMTMPKGELIVPLEEDLVILINHLEEYPVV